jgi:hypothetical protein
VVLGPVIAFVLLPRVPLGRAMLVTGAGTLAGILVSIVTDVMQLYVAGIAGFLLAAVLLRVFSSRRAAAPRERMDA